jgi:hypothetical protein
MAQIIGISVKIVKMNHSTEFDIDVQSSYQLGLLRGLLKITCLEMEKPGL